MLENWIETHPPWQRLLSALVGRGGNGEDDMKFLHYTDDTVHSEFYAELQKTYLDDGEYVVIEYMGKLMLLADYTPEETGEISTPECFLFESLLLGYGGLSPDTYVNQYWVYINAETVDEQTLDVKAEFESDDDGGAV